MLTLAYVAAAIAFLVIKDGLHNKSDGPRDSGYYVGLLSLACVCLAGLLACAAVFAARVRRMAAQRHVW